MQYELLGLIGSALLGICGIFQAIKSYKDKNSDGLSSLFILSWTLGEFIMLAYILFNYNNDYFLLSNYLVNCFSVAIISYYKIWPKRIIRIPGNVNEAIEDLDKILDKRTKIKIIKSNNIEETAIRLHSSLGRELRNRWGLWNNSKLAIFLSEKCNIVHPDDMSHFIIKSYYWSKL